MSITWNGISSDTIGVIVEKIPNRYVPTRRFSPQQVAGRNGNILLVDKAFPNVEQEYEVYLSAEAQGLPTVARACAEWLMGPDGYCRLTDSYDTTVYREAFLMGGFDIENILNKFGRCTITFSCKPQKYLLAGDTPIEIPAGTTTTYTGDVAQFDVITGASITSLLATISPIQDLHGYSSPWIGTDYDQQPYNFRAVSSSSVSPLGNSEMGNIVGGTVAWNQLATTAQRTESVTPDGTKTYSTSFVEVSAKANHVYFIAMTVKNYNGGKTLRAYCQINNTYGMPAQDLTGTSKAFAWLCKPSTGSASINYGLSNLATADKLTSADAWTRDDTQVFDLTAMFGSTIADYLYTLESGTAGAGIAKLKSWGFCTKPYYAYDAGSLQSVNTSAHKTYKADSTLLGNYALDSSLTLRGIPKLDANNNLYYDGDSYAPDGTVTRKYGTITLDGVTSGKKFTGTWGTGSSNPYGYTVYITFVRTKTSNVRCDKFVYSSRDRDDMPLYSFVGDSGIPDTWTFVLPSTITSLAEANTWLSNNPTTIVYELETPTTESATAYAATQSIDPDGTEEYVDYAESQGTRDVAIPVGHYTNYANICPISGRTGLSVYVSPTQDVADATTYAVDWTSEAGTVYGGTLDVVTGVLTVDRAYIASYNGETINEPWLSSMDAYTPGATPTTGAQVVYALATPLTYQLTAQEVALLVGTNNVWSSSGDVSVTVTTLLGGIVTNPTPFEARPLLTVSGVGEIAINGKSIQILESVSDFEIDCETMEAEDNSKIYCMDFPELSGGENKIVGYGSITALTVTPRWWTL